jgi:nucleoid DNA-binding protein
MTATGAFQSVAESTGLKRKQVKDAIAAYMDACASELKKTGAVNIGQSLRLKLKSKPATAQLLAKA